jgi:hypothetical protein
LSVRKAFQITVGNKRGEKDLVVYRNTPATYDVQSVYFGRRTPFDLVPGQWDKLFSPFPSKFRFFFG